MGGRPKEGRWTGETFTGVIEQMIPRSKLEALCREYAPVARTAPRVAAADVVGALIYHQMQAGGTLAEHGVQLHGVPMSDSAYAQRRQGLPIALFEAVMATALRPLADAVRQPECFFAGWRLVGIDGTEWSVTNTPAITGQLPKAATRRFAAAFAKLRLVTAVELGVHNPLAAAVGPVSEGEQTVGQPLWGRLPDRCLVIMDRLFGSPSTLWQAMAAWGRRPMAFLARVKENIVVERIAELADGSALVDVPVLQQRRKVGVLRVREIQAQGMTVEGRPFHLRFWTNLLDSTVYPAETLARSYVERWEHELYYRELKLDVRNSGVLASHTVDTALQELTALVLATAVVAQARVAAAEQLGVAPRRVSFFKVLLATRVLWQTLELGEGLLTADQIQQLTARCLEQIRSTALLPPRRPRSCPRAIRQPMKAWPRKLLQPSYVGRAIVHITRLP